MEITDETIDVLLLPAAMTATTAVAWGSAAVVTASSTLRADAGRPPQSRCACSPGRTVAAHVPLSFRACSTNLPTWAVRPGPAIPGQP
jgi:hypothetical protein